MYNRNLLHYVVVTVIPVNAEGKFLVARRSLHEKAFPGRWTVPGGKVEVLDYTLRERDTSHHWYNVFEDVAKREVLEEVGLSVSSLGYVTSMVYLRSDNIPCLIVSFYGRVSSEEVSLDSSLIESSWVTLEEAKHLDLIEGIYEELSMLDSLLQGKHVSWQAS